MLTKSRDKSVSGGHPGAGTVGCSVGSCSGKVVARGLCWKHYMRVRRHGDAGYQKRRYGKPPKCRYCGTRNKEAFYANYKSVCKECKKFLAAHAEAIRNTKVDGQ
jgi:hypothetical protein